MIYHCHDNTYYPAGTDSIYSTTLLSFGVMTLLQSLNCSHTYVDEFRLQRRTRSLYLVCHNCATNRIRRVRSRGQISCQHLFHQDQISYITKEQREAAQKRFNAENPKDTTVTASLIDETVPFGWIGMSQHTRSRHRMHEYRGIVQVI
jgi:hypothetical protein